MKSTFVIVSVIARDERNEYSTAAIDSRTGRGRGGRRRNLSPPKSSADKVSRDAVFIFVLLGDIYHFPKCFVIVE